VSLPARTAYVADHGSVTCAVVVESGQSAGLREEVRDIIAEYAAPAAKQARGMEPTMSLLFWLRKAPVRCIVTHHRLSSASPLVQALVADRVDTIVMCESRTFEPQVMITEDMVTPTVRLLQADAVSEPLLSLPEAVAWAYNYDLQQPGQKRSMTSMLADRMQVLNVG
jgi:hypothetical protein